MSSPLGQPLLCLDCPSRGRGFVEGEGPLDARLLILGERPGEQEIVAKRPFIGPSGKHLDTGLRIAGQPRANIRITNTRKCAKPEEPESAAASKAAIAYCAKTHLQPELDKMTRLRHVCCVGADAMSVGIGVSNAMRYHGSVLTKAEAMNMGGKLALPDPVHSLSASLHPAFALRGFPQFLPFIYTSIGRAVYWSRSPDPPQRAYDLTLLDDQKKLTEVCCGASPGDVIAVDVETPEGKPTHIDICSLAWSSTEGLCFTWNLTNQSIVRSLLENPSIIKVGHNFGYDIRAFKAQGIQVQGPCMDTMDMCALLWPQPTTKTEGGAGFPWHSLSACTLRVIEDFAYWKRPDTPATRSFYRAAFPRVDDWKHARLYCTLDSLMTKRLFHVTREMLKLQEMW